MYEALVDALKPAEKDANLPWQSRIASIDAYRALAIVLMSTGNYLAGVRWIPAFLKHQPDIGLTFADLVAPMFIFAIALTARLSVTRRAEGIGRGAALGKMAIRYLALIGIGAVFSAGQAMGPETGEIFSWGVLQAIGAAGLLLLPFIFSPGWVRLAVGLAYLAVYQFLLEPAFLDVIVRTTHNGLAGSLAWAGLLMLGTVAADWFHNLRGAVRLWALLAGSLVSTGLGLLIGLWIPISKRRASLPYMAISLGFCLLVFTLFSLLFDRPVNRRPADRRESQTARDGTGYDNGKAIARHANWFLCVGRNPLVLYMAHLPLLGLLMAPGDAWYAGAPAWLTILQVAVILAFIFGLATFLEKRGLVIKL